MDVEYTFIGGPELKRALADLPKAVERKVARQALRMGAKVLQKHLRSALPVDAVTPDGVHLNKSVGIFRPWERGLKRQIVLRVGYGGIARTYGPIVEFGNSRQQQQPVWRRAMATVGEQVVQTVIDKLAKDTLRETERLFRKTI